ncbi:hypothetical protein [Roseofilum sp. Guam]|uniref:hypothetical protein n=1 Tax=Roseofilum sp. Guam TaxID=2821502 RepID=UPI001B151145|nr:hypothetical protein [Roseofilum sp. Guam]MBP0031498.1 hypothetical protein [Roseofilum sp. Guam]
MSQITQARTAPVNNTSHEETSPSVSDKDWLEQELNGSGIRNPLLRKQFEVCFEGFTIQGISIDGVKLNPDSWQKRNRYPEKHLNKDGKPIKYSRERES